MRVTLPATLSLLLLLTGCSLSPTALPTPASGLAIKGSVFGGQQPIVNGHAYLFAANATGYGKPSVSLLNAAVTGHSDSVGAYVLTDINGAFTITGDYTCTPGTQVYLYGLGGNPGAGINAAIGLLAVLGNCPAANNFLLATPFIHVNEVSTIAAAYSMAGFATDALHVASSGTALAQVGIANAFANPNNLVTLGSGVALTTTPAGNGTVPQTTINTLANILAACVNTTGPTSGPCTTLFSNARSNGSTGTIPTDTATAAINLAHNPGANIATLYSIPPPTNPFSPTLAVQPNDFNLGIVFSGGGINQPYAIAIDAGGNVWIPNHNGNNVSKFSPLGAPLSPSTGFTGGGINAPYSLAIDVAGNAWVGNVGSSTITELTSTGTPVAGTPFTSGGINQPYSVALDAAGNVWVANFGSNTITELTSSGTAVAGSPFVGGGLNTPFFIAIDAASHLWIADLNGNSISEFAETGLPISPTAFTGGGLSAPTYLAIDAGGNIWAANNPSISKLSNTGSPLSPPGGFTGGGVSNGAGIAIDGANNVWVANFNSNSVAEFSNSGAAITSSTGYTAGQGGPFDIAIDGSGNVWTPGYNNNTVTELIGSAAPSVTPIVTRVIKNSFGVRP